MTISSATRKAGPFLGNGLTASFPFSFKVFETSDLQVIKTAATGTDSAPLILDSDYSVTLNVDQNNTPGGVITYPLVGALLASGEKLTAISVLPSEQQTHITNGGNFFANNIEDQMDFLTVLVQQLEEKVKRVALGSASDVNPVLGIGTAAQRANKYLTFDSGGNIALAQSLPSGTLSAGSIGQLLYPQTPAEAALSVTPVNQLYPEGYVDRYGVNTTPGTTDMTNAIQTAINVRNNWSVYSAGIGNKGAPGADFSNGGTIRFLGGKYLVTQAIFGAPNITLKGNCPIWQTGTNFTGASSVTIIKASGTFPTNQYVIDSGNWRRVNENGTAVGSPYRVFLATDQFVSNLSGGVDSNAFQMGFNVTDMLIDCSNRAFGGVRKQCSAFFRDDSVEVLNAAYVGFSYVSCFEFGIGRLTALAPIGMFLETCESFTQDGGELQLYGEPTASWVSGNQATINSVFYPHGNQIGTWYGLRTKALLVSICVNGTFVSLGVHAGDVALESYLSNVNILHWENEFTNDPALGFAGTGAVCLLQGSQVVIDGFSTKSPGPLASGDSSSQLVIREPKFIQCSTSFIALNGETTSTFEIQYHNLKAQPDNIFGLGTLQSSVNLTRMFPYTKPVTIFVNSSGSSTDVVPNNLQPGAFAHPSTIDCALKYIENNPHIKEWVLSCHASGQTHSIANAHVLKDVRITITQDFSGGSCTVSTSIGLGLNNAVLTFNNVAVGSWSSSGFFNLENANVVELLQGSVSIPNSKVIFNCVTGSTARVMVTGVGTSLTFGTSAGLCAGGSNGYVNYEDSLAFASIVIIGTAALEGITTGKVKKIASNIV